MQLLSLIQKCLSEGYFVQVPLCELLFLTLQYSAQDYHLDLPPYSALVYQMNTRLDEMG